VDDEPGMVTMLKTALEPLNYDTAEAQDGQEALKKIHEAEPDLVVLDIMMPKVDGYTVFKKLRSDPEYRKIPIIILTGDAEFEDVKKCIAEGVEAYLTKPVKLETFLCLVETLLREDAAPPERKGPEKKGA